MERNSIRGNLSKSDTISDIRMSLAADFKREKTVFVVEGLDDTHFWQNKISNNVYMCESFSGKMGVRSIVEHFNETRVIGICDRDYDLTYLNDHVFHYDFSCLEMMLLSNDAACESFIAEHYCENKNVNKVRLEVLNDLKWLSCFRKLNFLNSWSINFNGFSMHNSFDKTEMCLDSSAVLTELQHINNNFMQEHEAKLSSVTIESSEELSLHDLFSLTNGHDFLSYFHCLCMNIRRQKGRMISVHGLAASLRCAFRGNDLKNTALYSSIKEHEEKNDVLFLAI